MDERRLIEQFLLSHKWELAKTHRLMLEAYLAAAARAGRLSVPKQFYVEAITALDGRRIAPTTLANRLFRLNTLLDEKRAGFQLDTLAGEVLARSGNVADADARGLRALEEMAEAQGAEAGDIVGAVPARALKSKPDLQVFFSYGRYTEPGDVSGLHQMHAEFADGLALALKRRSNLPSAVANVTLFRDAHGLRDHDDLTDAYMEKCRSSFLLLAMLSGKYLMSSACRRERGVFIARGRRKPGRAVIMAPFDRGHESLNEINLEPARFLIAKPETHDTILKLWAKGDADDRQSYIDRIVESIFAAAADHVEELRSPAKAKAERPSVLEEVSGWELLPDGEQFIPARAERRMLSARIDLSALRHPGAGRDLASNADRTSGSVPGRKLGPGLRRDDDEGSAGEEGAEMGVPIVDHLIGWACDPDPSRARMFALLGEFGMGKTVNCRLFARRLLELRAKDRALPLPVYFDLRDAGALDPAETLALPKLVSNLLRRAPRAVDAVELIAAMRRETVVVIFDGLDEVTNKFSPAQAADFYRLLLSLVPGELWAEDKKRRRPPTVTPAKAGAQLASRTEPEAPSPAASWAPAFAGVTTDLGTARHGPRLLVSCRTHFFQAVESERAFLSDKERQGLDVERDIETYFLLPFSPEQIGKYLRLHLPEADATRLEQVIAGTYDLRELARRPVLLRFIREMAGKLEEEKLRGRTINLARLYDILVAQVLERDGGKHVLTLQDKRLILEDLALHLHVSGMDEIANDKLFAWFRARVAKDEVLGRALTGVSAPAILETWLQDLRNASLLVRPGEQAFRFAHTSVREFFLANALHRAVREGRGAEVLGAAELSEETRVFLLRRHEIEDDQERVRFAEEFPRLLREGVARDVRQQAVHVWLSGEYFARDDKTTRTRTPRPEVMDLSEIRLTKPRIVGSNLSRTVWRKTDTIGLSIKNCDFRNADLRGFDGRYSEWIGVDLTGSKFDGALLPRSVWRSCKGVEKALSGADISQATFWNCEGWYPHGTLPRATLRLSNARHSELIVPPNAAFVDELMWAIRDPYNHISIRQYEDHVFVRVHRKNVNSGFTEVDQRVRLGADDLRLIRETNEDALYERLKGQLIDGEAFFVSQFRICSRTDRRVDAHSVWSGPVSYLAGLADWRSIDRLISYSTDSWESWHIEAEGTDQRWTIEDLAERDGVRATEVVREM